MIKVGILTVSDRSYQNIRPDLSGPALSWFCQFFELGSAGYAHCPR